MNINQVFIGYDDRQPVSYQVLHSSIVRQAKRPVSITPLIFEHLPVTKQGLTPFTFTRFIVPWLCDYKGWGLFLDADMLLTTDISELFSLKDDQYDVMVVKNEKRFEWASVMLFNNEKCQKLTPDFINNTEKLHLMEWADNIGSLPSEWNHLVGYDEPRDDAKLIHYTQGVPCFPETATSEHADVWNQELERTISAMPWPILMGQSVHATVHEGKLVPKFTVKQ